MCLCMQQAKSGELDLTIDGQNVVLSSLDQEFTTESQTASGGDGGKQPTHGDIDPLNTTEKIIIGVVCGAVGLLIICIITFVSRLIEIFFALRNL